MAYDETLARRIRDELAADPEVTEKQMFGGVAFLRRGLMFLGIVDRSLMARVGKDEYEDSLRRKHVREMDFTGRPMKGYVFVDPPGLRTTAQLRFWIDRCERFVSSLPAKGSKAAAAARS